MYYLINFHKDLIKKFQLLTGLGNYQIIWIAWLEGLIMGLLMAFCISKIK
tara:strand:- start:7750 stop:7899 length:150 start_codon:yes stop_codon:yes gene_type:complete